MYKKVLVPLDGSNLAECALEHVKEISVGCHVTEVDLLFVAEPPPSPAELVPYSRVFSEMENYRARMKEYLNEISSTLKKEGVTVTKPIIIEGKAADAIINYAADNEIDLIIMSTHGRSGTSRWAFGSVADRVTRYSNVPVMIAVPEGCRIETSQP